MVYTQTNTTHTHTRARARAHTHTHSHTQVHVSTREEAVEYKYVRIRKDGKVTEWEGMKSNRRLDLTGNII
jgi:hypothetical protein